MALRISAILCPLLSEQIFDTEYLFIERGFTIGKASTITVHHKESFDVILSLKEFFLYNMR